MKQRQKMFTLAAALATGGALATGLLAGDPAPPQVSVADVNPGTSVERDLCLSVSLAPGAASECGDLRLAHALPAVRTLGRARAPVLLYNSQHASPHPIVAAHVTLPSGKDGLSRVVATLKVNGTPRGQGVWRGSAWPDVTGPVRIAVGYDAASDSTGPYRYTLEVRAHYGETMLADTARGELVVVNRRQSAFGAGWWLAGLERLVMDPFGKPVLWVGGDGSTRRYTNAGGGGVWGAPSLDRPDSIKPTASGGWERILGGGVKVEFDSTGRHVATVNRLAHRTEFRYDSQGRVETLTIPLAQQGFSFHYAADGKLERMESPGVGGTPRVTHLHRNGARVDSIRDPDTTSIGFGYADARALVPTSRSNRMKVATHFSYDAGGRVAGSRLDLSTTESIVHRLRAHESLGLATSTGTGAVDTARAYALLDGPRTDVGDSTRLWLDRWGAPRRIRNAEGRETVLTRGDPRFPALVTRMDGPLRADGHRGTVSASYDARGNLVAQTDSSTFEERLVPDPAGGQATNQTVYATTRYEYTDPHWPDFPTRTVLPEGESTSMGYDPVSGSRTWQKPSGDVQRNDTVRFAYYTSAGEQGYAPGLLSAVSYPGPPPYTVLRPAPCDTGAKDLTNCPPPIEETVYPPGPTEKVEYDKLGNVRATETALKVRTEYLSDALGRVVRVRSPIEGDVVQTDTTVYDGAGRVMESQSVGPALNGAPRQTLWVKNRYDEEGNLRSVSRWSDPDAAEIGRIINEFRYDAAGRRVAEVAPRPPGTPELKDSTVYDPAGNVLKTINRNGHGTSYAYDELNRLRRRTTDAVHVDPELIGMARSSELSSNPVGTAAPGAGLTESYPHGRVSGYDIAAVKDTFVYHPTDGTLTDANNASASVHFEYYANGQPRLIRTTVHPWIAGQGAPHTYETEIVYDLNGRRTSLRYPVAISPSPNATVRYGYSAEGELEWVQDLSGAALTTRYRYSPRGQLEARELTDGVTARLSQTLSYYADGNLRSDVVRIGPTTWRSQTFTYDPRGKRTGMEDKAAGRQGFDSNRYDGLGHLRQSTNAVQTGFSQTSTYELDALANIVQRSGADASTGYANSTLTRTTSSNNGEEWNYYQQGTGRLLYSKTFPARFAMDTLGTGQGGGGRAAVVHWYDSAGNAVWMGRAALDLNQEGFPYSQGERRMYYGADGKLHGVDTRALYRHPSAPPNGNYYGFSRSFEEYRYDALGRRVVTKFDQECDRILEFNLYNAPCHISGIRRTLWDGSRELGEIQVPNAGLEDDNHVGQGNLSSGSRNLSPFYGAVAYVYDGRVDQPLAVTRLRYSNLTPTNTLQQIAPFTFYPIWNVRGESEFGYSTASDSACASTMTGGERATCISYVTKERWLPYRQVTDWRKSWQGTLMEDKVGTSGLMYRRNRYYDPGTGRFTQEDPIGLAGGLNLYGFANGDPVGYSDPYGLKADSIFIIGSPEYTQRVSAALVDLAQRSPTFRRIHNGLASSSVANVYIRENGGFPARGCRGMSRNCTYQDGPANRIAIQLQPHPSDTDAELGESAAHELVHAAGHLAEEIPGLGVPADCRYGHAGSRASPCAGAFSNIFSDEVGTTKRWGSEEEEYRRRHLRN